MAQHYPRLPVKVGKARMKLLQAIVTGDNDLANWVRWAIDHDLVIGERCRRREHGDGGEPLAVSAKGCFRGPNPTRLLMPRPPSNVVVWWSAPTRRSQ